MSHSRAPPPPPNAPPAAPPANADEDEGASPQELLIEAARRDNVDLLEEILSMPGINAAVLNSAADPLGNSALHIAATYGSHDVMDMLLDQEGLEVDPQNKMDQDTPLHKAVYFARTNRDAGYEIVHMLLDAGADPRVKNRSKMRPIDVADASDKRLKERLQRGEYQLMMGDDVVNEDEDDGPTGSGSDSD